MREKLKTRYKSKDRKLKQGQETGARTNKVKINRNKE